MRPVRRRTTLALGLGLAAMGCEPAATPENLLARLGELRVVEPRRSGPVVHRACSASPRTGGVALCTDSLARRELTDWLPLVAGIEGAMADAAPSPPVLRALGGFDLFAGVDDPAALDRAVDRLRYGTELAPTDADLRNDLAVALLVRGEAAGDPWDTVEAVEQLERLLGQSPGHPAARYNRALALHRLELLREAEEAWRAVEESEPDPGWAGEASARTMPAPGSTAEADVPRFDLLARAMAGLVEGEIPSTDEAWDPVRAQAETLSDLGDAGALTLIDALQAPSGGQDASLRRAVQSYGEALDLWQDGAFAASQAAYRRVVGLTSDGAPGARVLRARAVVGAARGDVYGGRYAEAEAAFASVLSPGDEQLDAELRGHARWGLALSTGRRGALVVADEHLGTAISHFERLGQREEVGALRSMQAGILNANGETDRALAVLLASLPLFGRDGGNMHQNLLSTTGRLVASRYPAAAVAFHREGLRLSEGRRNAQYRVEALIRLAQAQARAGDTAAAAIHLAEARSSLSSVPDPDMRLRVQAEYDELVGMYVPDLSVAERDSLLDAAVTYFDTTATAVKLPALLERRGRHRIDTGRVGEGRDDLRRVLQTVEEQLRSLESPVERATLIQARSDAVDALVESHLAVGDTLGALEAFDRPRAVSLGVTRSFWDSVVDGPSAIAGSVVLAYAVVGDRVRAWTLSESGVGLSDLPISADELEGSVARLGYLLRTGASRDAVSEVAGRLHEALIVPLEGRLEGAARIVVVPDGALHALPFAVLGASPGGLLDRFVVVHAPSTAFALLDRSDPSTGSDAVLAASASTWDGERYPSLPPLRWAAEEARSVADLHATGPALDLDAMGLPSALESARLFHFAGHAVYRSDRPDLSELVLPGGGLRAARIATLDLSRLALAVLAACSTQEADAGRSGGLSGLTSSFLEAGAGGVIGSLWSVPDETTMRLMIALHRHVAAGESGADALRAVQREAARSGDSGWTWAAFRYEGR